jgi:hypothetical protein
MITHLTAAANIARLPDLVSKGEAAIISPAGLRDQP